ncbi:MAG: S8 family serine peptidase [Acidimicrobiia bacterium]
MKLNRWRRIGLLLAAALVAVPVGGATAGPTRRSDPPPKIDARLADLAAGQIAIGEAHRRGVPVVGDDILVEVVGGGDSAGTRSAIGRLGGTIRAERGGTFLVEIDPGSLLDLAGDATVEFVSTPAEALPDGVIGEGVAGQGADVWHDAGRDGAGIRVLVVDSGFSGLGSAQNAGDLPNPIAGSAVGPTCGGGLGGDSDHGTAVAEIVYDMAPGVELYLYRTCLVWDGPDIADFVRTRRIDIVTQSLAYFNTVPLDGRDPWGVFDHIGEVVDSGAVWFNSAGNYRQRHWRGFWAGGQTLDFGEPMEIALQAGNSVYLRWDDWRLSLGQCNQCATDIDVDLYLVDGSGDTVDSSTTIQSPADPGPPIEAVTAPYNGVFRIEIRTKAGVVVSPGVALDLFVPSQNLPSGLRVAAGSLNDASTLDSVLAVGAVCRTDSEIRPYSSEGPTAGGARKPDLSAFDGVSTGTFGPSDSCDSGFLGTSAASPHAAGAMALFMQATGARGAEAWDLLARRTIDLGPSGHDNRYGVGRIALASVPQGKCGGSDATIVAVSGQVTIQGTSADDVITGNSGANQISSESGDDWVCALAGADIIDLGDGTDRAWSGKGGDLVFGGPDADDIRGGKGHDDLRGGSGADSIFGGKGRDSIFGDSGADFLKGGQADDTLDGGPGTDECRGEIVSGCEV